MTILFTRLSIFCGAKRDQEKSGYTFLSQDYFKIIFLLIWLEQNPFWKLKEEMPFNEAAMIYMKIYFHISEEDNT